MSVAECRSEAVEIFDHLLAPVTHCASPRYHFQNPLHGLYNRAFFFLWLYFRESLTSSSMRFRSLTRALAKLSNAGYHSASLMHRARPRIQVWDPLLN